MQTSHWERLALLAVVETEDDERLERALHHAFARDRLLGEWFARSERLDEVIADALGRAPLPGTFADLCARDDRLARLADDARLVAGQAKHRPVVCAVDEWERRFRPRLLRLCGWERRDRSRPTSAELRTRAAYDVAEAGLRALLPECRGCLHAVHVTA